MRRLMAPLAGLVLVAAAGWVAWNLTAENAEACTVVSSAACRPYVQLVRDDLRDDAARIVDIESQSWCRERSCPDIFGHDPGFVLTVTFADREPITYRCFEQIAGTTDTPEGAEFVMEPRCSRGG